MGVPNRDELINPLLLVLQEKGGTLTVKEQEAAVATYLDLSSADINEIHRGRRTRLQYNLAWARFILKHLNLIENLEQSIWRLTPIGQKKTFVTEAEIALGNNSAYSKEEVEGVDGGPSETFGIYPIDSVLIRQETRTANEIVKRIEAGKFIMDPDFQREFIWPTDKQSKLIESTFLRIPLPVFYFAEREDGKTVVVDGLQRLTTFQRYLSNKFSLRSLEICEELNEKFFEELTPKLQNRVEDAQCILYLIDSKAPEQVKLDIFERVNGGIPLSRQQMRNCLYTGPATKWLKQEANHEIFLSATGHSLSRSIMRDRECVNRFCAFSLLTERRYSKGDMDAFLAETLRTMNSMPDSELQQLSNNFRQSMQNNLTIFGRHAFRKHRSPSERRTVINVAIFDVFSVLLSNLTPNIAARKAEDFRQTFYKLLSDPQFYDAISLGTNSTAKVQTRFSIARKALSPILETC